MATSMSDFSKACDLFGIDKFEEFQVDVLSKLLERTDVFLCMKTGGGKSLCYQAFHTLWKTRNDGDCQVLVVTPLLSIIKEQCEFLKSKSFSATYIGKDIEEDMAILEGKFDFLFSSPENLLGVSKWRDMLVSSSSIQLVVVDEAHTVLQWGESETEDTPFRIWYGQLGELRSLLLCPILVITATANRDARKKLQKKFGMKGCHEIITNPDRANIKLFVSRTKSTTPLPEIFQFLISMLCAEKEKCERYLIFCPSIKLCSQLYLMFRLETGHDIQLIEIFHSCTDDSVKERVKTDMNDVNGKIRIIVATSAAGMGVNFQGVHNVINYGPPKDMDSFVQQIGRAGRDGNQAMALMIYNRTQCKGIDEDMKIYIENTSKCRREILLSAYNSKPCDNVKHLCCDLCTPICACKSSICSTFNHPYLIYNETSHLSVNSSSDSSDAC